MDRISLSFGLAVGFEFLRTCSSFPVNNYKDAFADSTAWIGVSLVVSLAFVVVGIFFLAGCLCCRRETNGFKEFRNSVSTTNLSQVGVGFTNPTLSASSSSGVGGCSELSIFPPVGAAVTFEPLPNLQPLSAQSPPQHAFSKPPAFAGQSTTDPEFSITDWFAGSNNTNFPRDQLHYLREYGRGWFGRVVEGEARGVSEDGRNCKVVVRILREDATASEQKFFLNEVKTFRDLSHPNVLKLVARCLETDPYLILLEYCSSGDLKSFLCGNVASRTALCEQGICLRMMCDIANGLQHILQNGFVHTDLAARNCLVTSDLTVKVGDYGTSIEMYKDDYYIAGDVALPIRWCAPESLHCTDTTIETKQVTACANVWSLGVVLWEVCEFGALPYTSLSDDQVIVRVLGKERLKLATPTHPSLHTAHLYSLMNMCWSEEATRPPLDHVIAMLKHLQLTRTSSDDADDNFERRWETLKPNTIPVTDNHTPIAIRRDYDSGVDLDLKTSSDLDLKVSERDLHPSLSSKLKLNTSVSTSPQLNTSATGSPQLSVASSSGGEFFSPASQLTRQLSPSLTNLRGSFEDIVEVTVPSASPINKPSIIAETAEIEQFDSWLQGVDTTDEEEVKFVKNISEAIRDLDNRLAMEKTSSSSEASSRHESPVKEACVPPQNPVLDFRLGPITCLEGRPLVQELDSLQEDSLLVRRDSSSDTEEETWRGRIERGEFTEKVKEKSKSVADLMILTHIENSSDESDSLPSLTRQYSIEKTRRFVTGKTLAVPAMMTSIGFGSEGNIRGAVLGEEFQESLKLLQTAWKAREAESRQASLTVDQVQNDPCLVSAAATNNDAGGNFLGDTASEKVSDQCVGVESKQVGGDSSQGKVGSLVSSCENSQKVSLSAEKEEYSNQDKSEVIRKADRDTEKDAEVVEKVIEKSGDEPVEEAVETKYNVNEKLIEKSEVMGKEDDAINIQGVSEKCQVVEEVALIPVQVDEKVSKMSKGIEIEANQVTKSVEATIKQIVNVSKLSEGVEKNEIQNASIKEDKMTCDDFGEEDAQVIDSVSHVKSERPSYLTSVVTDEGFNLCRSNGIGKIDDVEENIINTDESQSITKESNNLLASSQNPSDLEKFLESQIEEESNADCRISTRVKREAPQFSENFMEPNKEDSVGVGKVLGVSEYDLVADNESKLLPEVDNEFNVSRPVKVGMVEEFLTRERGDVSATNLTTPQFVVEEESKNVVENVCIMNEIEEIGLDSTGNNCSTDETARNEFEINDVMDSLPESERIYDNEIVEVTNKEFADEITSDIASFVQSPVDGSTGLLQDNLDSKETSLSELESSSQSSEQTMTVVENDPLRNEEVIADLNSNSEVPAVNGNSRLPEIVVTEAVDVESVLTDTDSLSANYEFKPRRSIRILIAIDSSEDTDSENDCDVFDDSKFPSALSSSSSQPEKKQEESGKTCEEMEIGKLDLEKSFNSSDAINIFNLDEQGGAVDKLKAINVDLQMEKGEEDSKQSGGSNCNINESYSVILGSCEDYTLDYFKGLKTTSGKPATFDSDYSTNELSKSDSEIEDTDVMSTEDTINNWDTFLTNSLKDKIEEKGEEESFHVQFNSQQLDSVGSSDVNSEDTVIDDENEEAVRLNRKNLDFSSRDNNNLINEKNLNSRLLARDYENRNSRIINDNNGGRSFGFDDNNFSTNDQDRQMNEIKCRLEDVAKLSEGFQLKGAVEEEEDEGKLLTPDDERSSDSGFRDKGSLSESVEDACDEKYNLEDIEAELEEAYTKTGTESKYFSLHDETSSSSGEFSALATFPNPCLSSSRDEKDEKKVKVEEEVMCLKVQDSKDSKSGWFLHPHRATTNNEEEEDGSMSGWFPSPATPEPVKDLDSGNRSFSLDEELNAIRNELQEKLPCAQQVLRDADEDNSPEEERADMVIEYGSYPVPLSPIMEERESVSSNQSSIILDLHSNASSGKSSPMLMLDRNDSLDDEEEEAGRRFEEDIRTALDLYSSDSIESSEDVVDIIVEDLEGKEEGATMKIMEDKQEEDEDLLIVNTETNEVQLLESPRPKSHLAFVKQCKTSDKQTSSPSLHTYTPDSISPISTGSSRTGVALSFSSPDTGNLSSFLSPSSMNSEHGEYSTNSSLDVDVACVVKDLTKIVPNCFDHSEMLDRLKELEEESSDSSETEKTISVTEGLLLKEEVVQDLKKVEVEERLDDGVKLDENFENSNKVELINDSDVVREGEEELMNDNKTELINRTDLVLEKLLDSKPLTIEDKLTPAQEEVAAESKDWLKSVLLPLTKPDVVQSEPVVAAAAAAGTVLPKSSWPSSEELLPESKCAVVEVDAAAEKKKIELNSTLALLSPNLSVGTTDSSMVSSFSSTPTFDTAKSLADAQMSLSISSTDGEDSQRVLVPSLRALASEVLRLHKKVLKPLSAPEDGGFSAAAKKSLTLALDSAASAVSKVPMPSPEDADKGCWKPTVNQLMDLNSQSEHDAESDDLMTTSFIDGDADGEADHYNPDWESDTSDADSEDHSSSSGEFIWKSQDDIAEHQQHGMARIDEEDEEAADDDSSCGSTTEFVPSTWDKAATPTKSALRLADKKQDSLKRVCFKEQEYHCVYEYPGEPSDSDEDEDDAAMDTRKRNWETPTTVDYSCFADWELAEGEAVSDRDAADLSAAAAAAAEDYGPKSKPKKNDYDIYQLGAVDYDFTQMTTDDGEFFISSSARPFQQMGFSDVSSSEFFPGGRLSFDLQDEATNQQPDSENKAGPVGVAEKVCADFISNERAATNNSCGNVGSSGEQVGVGGLRHTREWLKLDLPATFSSQSSAVEETSDPASQVTELPKPDTVAKEASQINVA